MSSSWILIDKKEREIVEMPIDLRLYDLSELEDLLMKAGLEIIGASGSPEREEFHETRSRRILILSKKQPAP